MKHALFLILALTATVLTGCLDVDTPDDDKQLRGTAATLARTEAGENIFVTDDSIRMYPNASFAAKDSLIGMRYFVDFRLLEKHDRECSVELVNVQSMFVDSIKYDTPSLTDNPLTPALVWHSGSYINMLLYVKPNVTYKDFTLYDITPSSGQLHFALRHDYHNSPYPTNSRIALSFDISQYRDTLSTDSINALLDINVENLGPSTSTITIRK